MARAKPNETSLSPEAAAAAAGAGAAVAAAAHQQQARALTLDDDEDEDPADTAAKAAIDEKAKKRKAGAKGEEAKAEAPKPEAAKPAEQKPAAENTQQTTQPHAPAGPAVPRHAARERQRDDRRDDRFAALEGRSRDMDDFDRPARGSFGPRVDDYPPVRRERERAPAYDEDRWWDTPNRTPTPPAPPRMGPTTPVVSKKREEDERKEREELESIVKAIPEAEKATYYFSFKKSNPGAGKNGGGAIQINVGNHHPIGEDWKTTIKADLGAKHGPAFYEGTVRHQDGRTADVKPKWCFTITREEAESYGWRASAEDEEQRERERERPRYRPHDRVNDARGADHRDEGQEPAATPAATATTSDYDPDREARKAAWLEKRIQNVKLEKRLQRAEADESEDDEEDGGSSRKRRKSADAAAMSTLDAERRAMRAEAEAEISKIRAEHEAAMARSDAAAAAERAQAAADRAAERTALETKIREESTKVATLADAQKRTTDDLKTQFDRLANELAAAKANPPPLPPPPVDPIEQMTRLKDLLPVPVQPEKTDVAATIAAVSTAFGPLLEALIAKLTAPPPAAPKQPDPLEILDKLKSLVPKQSDPFELFVKLKDAFAPPQQKEVDPFALLVKAKELVTPAGKPPSRADLIGEMQQLADLSADLRRGGRGGDDEDDDDEPKLPASLLQTPGLEDIVKQVKTLESLGIQVKIGGEQAAGSTAQAIVSGIEKAVIAAGEAMAKAGVFNKGQDPADAAELQRHRLLMARHQRQQAQAHAQAQAQARGQRRMPPARTQDPEDDALMAKALAEQEAQRRRRADAQRRMRTPAPRQEQPLEEAEAQQAPPPPRQRPAPAPQPAPPPPPEPAEPENDGTPTSKDWGELCAYVGQAITSMEDPADAALHMLDKWPQTTMMIASAGSVSMIEIGLSKLASDPQVGPYASTVQELAGKLRTDPGRGWAELLLKNITS